MCMCVCAYVCICVRVWCLRITRQILCTSHVFNLRLCLCYFWRSQNIQLKLYVGNVFPIQLQVIVLRDRTCDSLYRPNKYTCINQCLQYKQSTCTYRGLTSCNHPASKTTSLDTRRNYCTSIYYALNCSSSLLNSS